MINKNFKAFFIKLITSAIILALTAFFTPNFKISNLYSLLIAAFILTLMDYLFNLLLKKQSHLSKGIVGFFVAIMVLYLTQFTIENYTISLPSAILGALIYSIISSYVSQSQNKETN